MKKKIRFKKVVAGIALSLAMLATVIPAMGATNKLWYGAASTSGSSIIATRLRKTTDSSVIVNYSNGPSSQMAVNILAYVNGAWDDCTYYTSSRPIYIVYENANSYIDVYNTAYEEHGACAVAPKFTATSAGYHEGNWRPDFE